MSTDQIKKREITLDQIYGETCRYIAEVKSYVVKIDAFKSKVDTKPVQNDVEQQIHADVFRNLTTMSNWIHCDVLKCLNDQEQKLIQEREKGSKRTFADFWESHNYCSKSFLRLRKYMRDLENKTKDYLSRDTFGVRHLA